ncbi:MAG: FecR domain-containing protein, partial [Armatimonadetes bacterium]|nr:FecR domain-containing protein [Armatimonadota bacterium]
MRRGKPTGPQQPQSLEESILAAVHDVEQSGVRGKRREAARKKRKQVKDLFRGWKSIVLWVLAVLAVFIVDGVRREYKEFAARPSDISGTVQVLKHGETAPVTLTGEERLKDDDLVITGPKSMVTLLFPDGSAVQVEPETRFQVRLLDFERGGKRDRSFMVESGAIVTHVSQFFGAKSQATVCTPTAVAAVRGTSFRVSFDPATQSSSVHVVDGMVEMRTPRAKGNVIPGQVTSTQGYDPRGTEVMNADLVRRLSLRTEQLKVHEEPPGAVDSFEAKLTNLADPILQLMGIV